MSPGISTPPGVLLSVPLPLRLPSGLCSDPASDFWRHLSPEVFVYFLVMAGLRGPEVTVSSDFATSQYVPKLFSSFFYLFFFQFFGRNIKRFFNVWKASTNDTLIFSNIFVS